MVNLVTAGTTHAASLSDVSWHLSSVTAPSSTVKIVPSSSESINLSHRSESALASMLKTIKVFFTNAAAWVGKLLGCQASTSSQDDAGSAYTYVMCPVVSQRDPLQVQLNGSPQARVADITSIQVVGSGEKSAAIMPSMTAALNSLASLQPDMKVVLRGLFDLGKVLLADCPSPVVKNLPPLIKSSLLEHLSAMGEDDAGRLHCQLMIGSAADICNLLDFANENFLVDDDFLNSKEIATALVLDMLEVLGDKFGIKGAPLEGAGYSDISQLTLADQDALKVIGCDMNGFVVDLFPRDRPVSGPRSPLMVEAEDWSFDEHEKPPMAVIIEEDDSKVLASLTETLSSTLVAKA